MPSPSRAHLDYYSSEEIEALARSLETGLHRDPEAPAVNAAELDARRAEDRQDGELVRVAAYAGLRRGELVALRWRDVDFTRRKIVVRRAVSANVDTTSTKSRRAREVPLPDQAAGALDRLSQRGDFTTPDDYVFVNRLGRRLDGSAVRRRVERARDASRSRPMRFHDLRHTYGSLLVAGGIDLASVKAAMGHSRLRRPSDICTRAPRRSSPTDSLGRSPASSARPIWKTCTGVSSRYPRLSHVHTWEAQRVAGFPNPGSARAGGVRLASIVFRTRAVHALVAAPDGDPRGRGSARCSSRSRCGGELAGNSRSPPNHGFVDFEEEIKEEDPCLLQRGAPGRAQQRVREVAALGSRQDIEVNPEERHTSVSDARAE